MPFTPLPMPMRGFAEGSAHGRWDPALSASVSNFIPWDGQEARNRLSLRQGSSAIYDFSGGRSPSDLKHIQALESATVYVGGIRTERMVAVHGGEVFWGATPGTSFSSLGMAFSASGNVASVVFLGKVYLTDGTAKKIVDLTLATPVMSDWNATAGVFPNVGGSEYPTLLAQFGARIALAGIESAPTNWFLSSINDPTDFTGATASTLHKSINGDSATLGYGRIGEPIRALMPFGERGLVFGCDSTMSLLTADPASGPASIIVIARSVGVPGGPRAWCAGDSQDLFVLGTDGLYRLTPNNFRVEKGRSISAGRLDRFFQRIPWSQYRACLVWDHERRGVWIFITPLTRGRSGLHMFYDTRTDSFWPIQFFDRYWDGALCACETRPPGASNPLLVLGGSFSRTATFAADLVRAYDGYPFPGGNTSAKTPPISTAKVYGRVVVGPMSDPAHAQLMLKAVSVHMDQWRYSPLDVGVVSEPEPEIPVDQHPTLSIRAGPTAEAAVAAPNISETIVVQRLSHFEVGGGTASTTSFIEVWDGGDAAETLFASGTIDGRLGRSPTGDYQLNNPNDHWMDYVFVNPSGYEMHRLDGDTPETRTFKIIAPDGVDPEYVSTGGIMGSQSHPVLFVSAYPAEPDPVADIDDSDQLRAIQQLSGDVRMLPLGNLFAGRNADRRCRVRAGGIAVQIETTGHPCIIDTVAIEIEPRPRSRNIKANR